MNAVTNWTAGSYLRQSLSISSASITGVSLWSEYSADNVGAELVLEYNDGTNTTVSCASESVWAQFTLLQQREKLVAT